MGKRRTRYKLSEVEKENAALAALSGRKESRLTASASARLQAVAFAVAETLGFKLRPLTNRMKATPEDVSAILQAIKDGLPIDKAVVMAGVAPTSVILWRKANADIDVLLVQAELNKEGELLRLMEVHAKKDHKAASWLLERKHGMESRSKTEITGKDGGPIMALTIHKQLIASVASGQPSSVPRRAEVIDVPVDTVK